MPQKYLNMILNAPVYDVASETATKVRLPPKSKDKSLERFALSPDGTSMAFTAHDGRILLADAARGQWRSSELKASGTTRAVCFSHDSTKLYAAGGSDHLIGLSSVEVFDPQTGAWTLVAPMSREVKLGLAHPAVVGPRGGTPFRSSVPPLEPALWLCALPEIRLVALRNHRCREPQANICLSSKPQIH